MMALIVALLALFAIDSIVTYVGIAHGSMTEYNPVVRHLIGTVGLANAMAFIFIYKSALVSALTRVNKPWVYFALCGLFTFYAGALWWSWIVYLNHF